MKSATHPFISVPRLALLASLAVGLFCSAALAQTLVGVKVDKPQVTAGQPVQATVAFDVDSSANCGIRFEWGDGVGQDIKVEDVQKLPLVLSYSYPKAGDYTVKVTPKKVTSRLGCVGKEQSAMVKVSAPAPVAAAPVVKPAATTVASSGGPASAPSSASSSASANAFTACPAGWTLNAKSVNKKTKAFSCTAKPGTAAPEQKLSCQGATGYFENVKKGVIGCQA